MKESKEQGRNPVEVPIRNLPDSLFANANRYVATFALGIGVLPHRKNAVVWSCSATLVELNGRRGLLTARHVWQQIRSERCDLYLMLDRRGYKFNPDRAAEPICPVAEGKYMETDDGIPDICFVPLATREQSALEARGKAFYSIDRRLSVEDLTKYALDGFWIVAGAPSALIRDYPEENRSGIGFMMYSTSVSDDRPSVCGWDLILVDLNIGASNPAIPSDLGGLSGGGLWRIRIYVRENDRAVFLDDDLSKGIVLSGVVIAQTELVDRRLIAHGPRSIYERLRSAGARS